MKKIINIFLRYSNIALYKILLSIDALLKKVSTFYVLMCTFRFYLDFTITIFTYQHD